MRRRQVWTSQRKEAEFGNKVTDPTPPIISPVLAKGDCPHCGANFPRGLHLHVKKCARDHGK